MTDLPREVRKVINARASDAITAIYDSVQREDRSGLEFACRELVGVLEDETAAQGEWRVDPDYECWLTDLENEA